LSLHDALPIYRLELARPAGELGADDVDRLDRGRLREQGLALREECLGRVAGNVRLARGLIGEGIEDAELGWTHAHREECSGPRLLIDDRHRTLQELGDRRSLARPGIESNEQTNGNHLELL